MADRTAIARQLERVRALADLLKEGYEPQWAGGLQADGSRVFPYPVYDDRVFEGLEAAISLAGGHDYEYLDHIEAVRTRPAVELTLPELATWFTWLVRGERFVDGHVGAHMRDGVLGRRLARLLELVPAGASGEGGRKT